MQMKRFKACPNRTYRKLLHQMKKLLIQEIWQETYTYLADTQDSHVFPDRVEKNGVQYQLKDTQYQITELTKEYRKSSTNLWAYAEYNQSRKLK